jgi:hypothetical protein
MVGNLLHQSYHESTAPDEYYPVGGTKSETDNRPDDSRYLALVKSSGLQNQSLSRVIFRKFSVPYLRRVLPESFGIGYNRGITSARAIFFLTVGKMSQCIVICPSCGREILSDNEARRTPRGRIVCNDCAQDTYLDVPLT